jgi:hypothetical protein
MRLSEVVPPASWTIVMASGVIAIDLYDVHLLLLSTIMLGFAAAVWLLLAVVLGTDGVALLSATLAIAFRAGWLLNAAVLLLLLGLAFYVFTAARFDLRQVLTTGTLVLWCLAVVWLLPLIVTEAIRPRLDYDVRRWATVFPLGMYPACSFAVGKVTGIAGIITFGQVGTWVGVAALLLALAGLARSLHHTWQVQADTGSSESSPSPQKGQPHGSR